MGRLILVLTLFSALMLPAGAFADSYGVNIALGGATTEGLGNITYSSFGGLSHAQLADAGSNFYAVMEISYEITPFGSEPDPAQPASWMLSGGGSVTGVVNGVPALESGGFTDYDLGGFSLNELPGYPYGTPVSALWGSLGATIAGTDFPVLFSGAEVLGAWSGTVLPLLNFAGIPTSSYGISGALAGVAGFVAANLVSSDPYMSGTLYLGFLENPLDYLIIEDTDLSTIFTANLEAGGELQLEANAVPVPAAVWLLGSGLMGLMGLRRKTRT